MNQTREKVQSVLLILLDMICFLASYFGAGYIWLVGYRNVSVVNMRLELMDNFYITFIAYLLLILFSDLEKDFIRRTSGKEFMVAVKASIALMLISTLTIFVKHNNAEVSRGVYIAAACINLILFFATHLVIKYYLLRIYRNKKAVNQIFLVTTADRVQEIVKDSNYKRLGKKDHKHRRHRRQPGWKMVRGDTCRSNNE